MSTEFLSRRSIEIFSLSPADMNGITSSSRRGSLFRNGDEALESGGAALLDIDEALKELTVTERDTVYFEQHGMGRVLKDDTDIVRRGLWKFEGYIEKLKRQKGVPSEAYQLAEQQDICYVADYKRRRSFLRAENYDAADAAARMIRYFELKRDLFGDHLLGRDVNVDDDLTPEDQEKLKNGFVQGMRRRDSAGRLVLVYFASHEQLKEAKSLARILFCYGENMQDDTSEKKGIVVVWYHLGSFNPLHINRGMLYYGARMASDFPLRISAFHNCMNDKRYRVLLHWAFRFLSKDLRAKTKIHCGAHQECIYSLMCHGIPKDYFPVSADGKIITTEHKKMIEARRELTEIKKNQPNEYQFLVEFPENEDVLIGKSSLCRSHPGNIRLQHLVEEYFMEFDTLENKKDKSDLIAKIMGEMKDDGTRFLNQEKASLWKEIDNDEARKKIGNMFRNLRKKVNKQGGIVPVATRRRSKQQRLSMEDLDFELDSGFLDDIAEIFESEGPSVQQKRLRLV